MTPPRVSEIFRRLRAANPAPRSELVYASPFELLVSVILSAQATDKSVNLATAGLFQMANTPAALLELGRRGLERHIRRIGLYRTKSKNILATCKLLIEKHGGAVPRPEAPRVFGGRMEYASDRKARLARRALPLFHDGQLILLDGGSTHREGLHRFDGPARGCRAGGTESGVRLQAARD